MILFVGLGNPGRRYEETRHNIGFKVIDHLVERFKARDISKNAFQGLLFRASDSFFLKPLTFMNLSGTSVDAVRGFFKIDLENIIVIHDDIDLPFGAVRFKKGGGDGGHNGLKSIDAHLTKAYIRVRIGVGKPLYKSQVPAYVLQDFSKEESALLSVLIKHIADACESFRDQELLEIKSLYSLKSIEGLRE